MKCTIPEISWHNREPVLSIDINPIFDKFYRLATGGADCHVLIWQLNRCDSGAVKIEPLSDLTRHQRAVNSVRWSPQGQYLATADDDANIIIWQLKTDNIPLLEGETNDKETWIVYKVLRGHKEDIYDVCWSPNGLKLLSGSVDNTAIIWDLVKGKNENILTDHKGFVQGVSWDPKGHYFATISTDRVCRIFSASGKQVKARIQKGFLPVPDDHYLHKKEVKFFYDDTFKSFFRRLDFSPEGTLLAIPSGKVEIDDCDKIFYATYIFAVENWTEPMAVLPSIKQCSTVVRFCPILFELHEDGPEAIFSLPYRMIFAIGTDHDVILYDTQQLTPFAYFKDIHYTRLTDLTWSKDGLLLIASSTDGFCALITFEPNELGVQYVKEDSETEDNILEISGCEELDKSENMDISKEKTEVETVPSKPRKPNLLEQWAIKTPKKSNITETDTNKKNEQGTSLDSNKTEDNSNKRKNVEDSDKDKIVPKRIRPIPVDDTNKLDHDPQKDSSFVEKATKASPLLNFLKKASKKIDNKTKKSETMTSPIQPVIILDEIEARDAWKCGKEEVKCSVEDKNMTNAEDYTEEFSLHLEDTATTDTKIKETSENCKEPKHNHTEDKNSLTTDIKNKTEIITNENTDRINTTENCVQSKVDSALNGIENTEHEQKHASSNTLGQNNSAAVANIEKPSENTANKPKKRIPLITLSSPKTKKK